MSHLTISDSGLQAYAAHELLPEFGLMSAETDWQPYLAVGLDKYALPFSQRGQRYSLLFIDYEYFTNSDITGQGRAAADAAFPVVVPAGASYKLLSPLRPHYPGVPYTRFVLPNDSRLPSGNSTGNAALLHHYIDKKQ